MKSEHRHELAENDLSKLLGRWAQTFDQQANKFLIAIIVAALIAAVFIYWTRTSEYRRTSGWTELAAATTPEEYETVADTFSGYVVGDWARLRAANGFLHEGIRLSLTDRPASNDRLEQAERAYESLTGGRSHAAVREQALLGLAMTLETKSNGDTEPAIAAYQKLLDEYPDTRFKTWAEERIAALKTGSTQEFYAWFHQQSPKPADMPLPRDQGGGQGDLESILRGLDAGGAGGVPLGDSPFDVPVPLGGAGGSSKRAGEEDVNPFAEAEGKGADAENGEEPAPDGARPADVEPGSDTGDATESAGPAADADERADESRQPESDATSESSDE